MSQPTISDEDLWQFIRQHQESAFSQLMERHLSSLLHYGRKFSTDTNLVQDCVQDVLADLWLRRIHPLPIVSVRAYLFAATRNRVSRQDRKNKRFESLPDQEQESTFSVTFSVEDTWIADETERDRLQQLNILMNQLPPRQKEIIYLRYYQGLDKDQIAAVLNINYQSVSNLLHRTLTNLRNQFPTTLPVFFWMFLGFQ